MTQVLETWKSTADRQLLRVVVERGLRLTESVSVGFRSKLEIFLNSPGEDPDWAQWPEISEITRAAIHDALALGRWSAEELRLRLHAALKELSPGEAATRLLDLIFAKRRALRYIQRRSFLPEDANRLGLKALAKMAKEQRLPPGLDVRGPLGVEDESSDAVELAGKFEFAVEVEASSSYEAKVLGRDRVHTLLIAHYAQNSGALSAEANGSLLPEVLPFEIVEGVEHEGIGLDPGAILPAGKTLSKDGPNLGRIHDLFAPSAWVRKGTPDSRQRALRARRGLILSRDPDRRPEERLALAWAAVEQLISAGDNSKADAIGALASAIGLLQMRRSINLTYSRAWHGLCTRYLLEPDASLDLLVDDWMAPSLAAELRHQVELVLPVRTAYILRRNLSPSLTDGDALKFLMNNRASLLLVRDVIMAYSPLASCGLHEFVYVTGDGKRPGMATSVPVLGNGKVLAESFEEQYHDALSFFAHVYELRNRFVHSGDGFDLSREPAAADAYERFVSLSLSLMNAVQARIDAGMALEDVWVLSQLLAKDLLKLPEEKVPLSAERLCEILTL